MLGFLSSTSGPPQLTEVAQEYATMSGGYDAFISYSHAADGRLAPELQKALHKFAKPWYQRRALHVFRDQTNLSVNPHLWSSIEAALSMSDFFILLASPEAASSKWVRREIDHWLESRSPESLLIVVTDGDLIWDEGASCFDRGRSTALPERLHDAYSEEPLFIDLRWARERDDICLRNAGFRQSVGRIAATLRGAELDELLGEDVRQHRRTRRIATTAVLLLAALTVLSFTFFVLEREAARDAKTNLASVYLQQGRQELEAENPLRSLAYFQSAFATAPYLYDTRYMFSSALRTIDRQRRISQFTGQLRSAAFARNSDRVLLVGADGWIELWDVVNEKRLLRSAPDDGNPPFADISQSGRWLIAGGNESPMQIRHADSGAVSIQLPGRAEKIKRVSMDNAAERIVVVRDDYIARVWDAASSSLIAEIDFNVWDAELSPDGKYLVTASGNGYVGIWDPKDGRNIALIGGDDEHVETPAGWSNVSFAPTTRKAVVSGERGQIIVIELADDPNNSRVIPLEPVTNTDFFHSSFSPDEQYVVSVAWDGFSRVWNATNGELKQEIQSHLGSDRSAGWGLLSLDNQALITMVAATREVRVWTLADGKFTAAIDGPPGWIVGLGLSQSLNRVVTADRDGGLRTWAITSGGSELQLTLPDGENIELASAAFSRDAQKAVLGNANDGSMAIFDIGSGEFRQTLSLGDEALSAREVAISRDGNRVLGGGVGSYPTLWFLDQQNESLKIGEDDSPLAISTDLDLGLNGTVAAVAFPGRVVIVRHNATTRQLSAISDARVYCLALSPDATEIALSGPDIFEIRTVASGQVVTSFERTSEDRNVLAYNGDGSRLAAGGGRGTGWIWDTTSGNLLATLEGHTGNIRSLFWTDDGNRLVTSGNDGIVRVWNADTGELLDVLRGVSGPLIGVVEAPDQDAILSVSKSGSLQNWPLPNEEFDHNAIERSLACNLPWTVAAGSLVPRSTRSDDCT